MGLQGGVSGSGAVTRRVAQSWDYIVASLKLIGDKERRLAFRRLLDDYSNLFIFSPASVKYHHNRMGGLAVHTAQVLRRALLLHSAYGRNMPSIRAESVYIVAVLHDLAKTQIYELNEHAGFIDSSHPYQFMYKAGFKVEHDVWTIAVANSHGLNLSYDEMMGILQAHGGWSKINEPTNKLAVIIHCADMLSSQILKK